MNWTKFIKTLDLDQETLLESRVSAVIATDQEGKVTACNPVAKTLLALDSPSGLPILQLINLPFEKSIVQAGNPISDLPLFIKGEVYLLDFFPKVVNHHFDGAFFVLSKVGAEAIEPDESALFREIKALNSTAVRAWDGVIIVDPEGTVTMVNQAFADMLGAPAEKLIGRPVSQISPESRLSRLLLVNHTGRAEAGMIDHLGAHEVIMCMYPIEGNDVKPAGAIGLVQFRNTQQVIELARKIHAERALTQSTKPDHQLGNQYSLNNIVGISPQIVKLKETVAMIAPRGSNVLIRGESGTGKELYAHALHSASNRRYGPFVKVNCAAIPETLLESELFGYVEGAFTGARKGGQIGKFELANKGTIFLDEIGDMSMPMQAKLLRVVQEREFEPLGSNKGKRLDVRIVAATNVDLEEKIRLNEFREDLYYRLNVVTIQIPPLRERPEDIDLLVDNFLEQYNREFGLNIKGLSFEVRQFFLHYKWPGNIRELKNVIERAFNVVTGKNIQLSHLPQYLIKSVDESVHNLDTDLPLSESFGLKESVGHRSLDEIMDSLEQQIIQQALCIAKGNKALAANLLGISRPGLYKKLQKLHLDT